jgi:hypothetical protein
VNREPLDVVPLWLLAVLICAGAGLALEGGYRLGRWRQAHAAGEKEAPVGAMVGAILALFAFMLAFTFGLAATRFEARRQAVLDDANAIGTTYLRTRLLPEPQRNASAVLLREYVDVRVNGLREGRVEQTIARSEELHALLWAEAVRAAEAQPGPITGLYIQSLNQMIDLHATRLQVGVRNRIPLSIWGGLLTLALLGMASVGYQAGLSATRRSPAMLVLVLAFSGVLLLIADLDRGQEGFLRVSQQALIDLQPMMSAPPRAN